MPVRQDQKDFVELLMARQALRFGDFTLKSGRKSPYFFNTGNFNLGGDLARIGAAYAATIRAHFGDGVDCVFGPAYKGIPLALATAQAYQGLLGRPVGWTYDRKEAKDHGDGGLFVGHPLTAGLRVVIVDDVITDGKAKREALEKLRPTGVDVRGLVVAVDRQENGPSGKPALQAFSQESGVPVAAIITISDAVEHLAATGGLPSEDVARVRAHLAAATAR